MLEILLSKPVLIGLHLAFAIIGIDAFLWLLGEIKNDSWRKARLYWSAIVGVTAFILSWLSGGYYYVKYYGGLVKPIIQKGLAPWAHNIIMETKEHIFLFIIPLALTALSITFLDKEEFEKLNIKWVSMILVVLIVGLGLVIGAMGFTISAAARWGVQ